MSFNKEFEINSPQTMLIIEDQLADQILIKKRIEQIWPECEVVSVTSIQNAYELCKAESFDMVILDLNLPDGYGPSSVQEMRRFNRNVPIIVVTGMLSNVIVSESLKNGASHILSKKQMMDDDFFNVLKENRASSSYLS